MKRPLGELAELVNGQLTGDAGVMISDAKTIACSGSNDITFACQQDHLENFYNSASCAALVSGSLDVSEIPEGKHVIEVTDPVASFAKVVESFRPTVVRKKIGISPAAHVSPSAKIADDVDIYPGAFVGDDTEIGCGTVIHANASVMERCKIGSNVTIFPNAVLYEDTVVGDRSIIHGGAIIGAYGFGYKTVQGRHKLSAQLGNVVIECDVEVGAATTIDRGTFDSTVIGEGSKLDDQVMVAHNCRIGKHNLLCSQVGIAGSCETGEYVVMAGQVGVGDHLKIGNNATLYAKAGIMHNIPDGQTFFGIPAKRLGEQMKIHAVTAKLPEMRKQMKQLTKSVAKLELAVQASLESAAENQLTLGTKKDAA